MTTTPLLDHLRARSLRRDGPFTLRSGVISDWYLDARNTTFDGEGAMLVAEAVLSILHPEAEALGGMTMGADPIAVATATVGTGRGRRLAAFSVRKEAKDHGSGGRVVGPVRPGMRVVVVEDTTTTGAAAAEAVEAIRAAGMEVVQVIALVDRSGGQAASRFSELGVPYAPLFTETDLGVEG